MFVGHISEHALVQFYAKTASLYRCNTAATCRSVPLCICTPVCSSVLIIRAIRPLCNVATVRCGHCAMWPPCDAATVQFGQCSSVLAVGDLQHAIPVGVGSRCPSLISFLLRTNFRPVTWFPTSRTHACMNARMHAHTHTHLQACPPARTPARMHARTPARMHAPVCKHARTHLQTHRMSRFMTGPAGREETLAV